MQVWSVEGGSLLSTLELATEVDAGHCLSSPHLCESALAPTSSAAAWRAL